MLTPALLIPALLIPALLALVVLATPSLAADTPAGLWETPGCEGGAPAGVIRLFLHDGLLYGQIDQVYDPARRALRCTRCTDDRKDAPFLGLQIIRALHPDGDAPAGAAWSGGTVLDPDTGRTYRTTIRLLDAAHLTIRGYLGLPLFGATQSWTRLGTNIGTKAGAPVD